MMGNRYSVQAGRTPCEVCNKHTKHGLDRSSVDGGRQEVQTVFGRPVYVGCKDQTFKGDGGILLDCTRCTVVGNGWKATGDWLSFFGGGNKVYGHGAVTVGEENYVDSDHAIVASMAEAKRGRGSTLVVTGGNSSGRCLEKLVPRGSVHDSMQDIAGWLKNGVPPATAGDIAGRIRIHFLPETACPPPKQEPDWVAGLRNEVASGTRCWSGAAPRPAAAIRAVLGAPSAPRPATVRRQAAVDDDDDPLTPAQIADIERQFAALLVRPLDALTALPSFPTSSSVSAVEPLAPAPTPAPVIERTSDVWRMVYAKELNDSMTRWRTDRLRAYRECHSEMTRWARGPPRFGGNGLDVRDFEEFHEVFEASFDYLQSAHRLGEPHTIAAAERRMEGHVNALRCSLPSSSAPAPTSVPAEKAEPGSWRAGYLRLTERYVAHAPGLYYMNVFFNRVQDWAAYSHLFADPADYQAFCEFHDRFKKAYSFMESKRGVASATQQEMLQFRVENLIAELRASLPPPAAPTTEPETPASVPDTADVEDAPTSTTTGDDDEGNLCTVCMAAPLAMVFIPCGHVCTCMDCGGVDSMENCPVCRVPINNRVRTYRVGVS